MFRIVNDAPDEVVRPCQVGHLPAIEEHLSRDRTDPVAAIRAVDFETITAEAREAETVSVGSASEDQGD